MSNSQTIKFHLKTGEHGWLSNFAPYLIAIDGVQWPTSEHYYQASKFPDDPAWQEEIRRVVRPYDAWRMGRHAQHPVRSDWHLVKDEVMERAVRAKFAQHADLRQRLLETGDALLVEHAPADPYWGDGGDGKGENRLGRLLMQIRQEYATLIASARVAEVGWSADEEAGSGEGIAYPATAPFQSVGPTIGVPSEIAWIDTRRTSDVADSFSAMNLQSFLPQSKTDCQAVDRIAQLGYPAIAPILPQLLEWLQDGNWPIAKRLAPWLANLGLNLVPALDQALASEDQSWNYWLIALVISRDDSLYHHYRPMLLRFASSPSLLERQYEIDEVAREALRDRGEWFDR